MEGKKTETIIVKMEKPKAYKLDNHFIKSRMFYYTVAQIDIKLVKYVGSRLICTLIYLSNLFLLDNS